jgi:tripartite-type tricarboxylate transporter receptor subunit TctC
MAMKTLATTVLLAISTGAFSQSYPAKSIRVIATSVSGNAGDTAMRLVSPAVGSALGQQLVMENRPQGLGQPAMLAAKEAAPDGYTLLHASVTNMTWTPYLSKEVRTDTMKDFVAVVKLIDFPNLIAVNTAVPAGNLAEFLEHAKRNAGKLTYGSTGLRSGFEFFPEALGLNMLNVPYANQSVGQTVNDLAAGRIDALFYSYASLAPVLSSGRVKVLAQVSRQRIRILANVPTVYETLPEFAMGPAWFGLFAPAGTIPPIIQRVNAEVNRALADPQTQSKMEGVGTLPGRGSPDDFAREVRRDYEVFGRLAKALKLEPM